MNNTIINDFNAAEKIFCYMDKLDYFFNRHKTLIVAEVDLTNYCNNRCPGCCGVKGNHAELTISQIDDIAEGLARVDCKGVIFSGGGEPLLSPHFSYAVRRFKEKGLKLGLNSNGLALNEKLANEICESFEYFRISLDAATYQLYQNTHGMPKEAFDKTIENIKMFATVKKNLKSNISFGVGFLTNKNTSVEMEQFVVLAKKIKADFAQFRPFIGDLYDISEEYQVLKEKYEENNFVVRASVQKYKEMKFGGTRNYTKCRGMFFSTVITADAKVFACIHHRQENKFFLGDIQDSDSLKNIFQGGRILDVYESIQCMHCPIICRNDSFNRTLQQLSESVYHKEFL